MITNRAAKSRLPFLKTLLLACLTSFAFVNGQEKTKRQWPKELDGVMDQYRSSEVRNLIIISLKKLEGNTGAENREGVVPLLDLQNPDLSFWVLTHPNAYSLAFDDLEKRKLSVDDAPYLLKAMLFYSYVDQPGGIILTARAKGLSAAFSRALKQKHWYPQVTYKKDLLKWSLHFTDQAIQQAGMDKGLRMKLELLRDDIIRLKAQTPEVDSAPDPKKEK